MTQQIWLTDRQAGERYGCSKGWIWQKLKSDPLFPRPVRFSGGTTRWSIADLDAYDGKLIASHKWKTPHSFLYGEVLLWALIIQKFVWFANKADYNAQ